jgi:hypothetical protein
MASVTVSAQAKMNLGNYESRDFFVSMTDYADPLEDRTLQQVHDDLVLLVETSLCRRLVAGHKSRGQTGWTMARVAKHYGLTIDPLE